jgi:hypothetical protein
MKKIREFCKRLVTRSSKKELLIPQRFFMFEEGTAKKLIPCR